MKGRNGLIPEPLAPSHNHKSFCEIQNVLKPRHEHLYRGIIRSLRVVNIACLLDTHIRMYANEQTV